MDYSNCEELIDNEEKPTFFAESSYNSLFVSNEQENDVSSYSISKESSVSLCEISNAHGSMDMQYYDNVNLTKQKSLAKSYDSGLAQSNNYINVTGIEKKINYDHVESKVKKYIKDIKRRSSVWKSQDTKSSLESDKKLSTPCEDNRTQMLEEENNLLRKELQEKDVMIECFLEQIEELQNKCATNEMKVEDLRLKIYHVQSHSKPLTPRSNRIMHEVRSPKYLLLSPLNKNKILKKYKDESTQTNDINTKNNETFDPNEFSFLSTTDCSKSSIHQNQSTFSMPVKNEKYKPRPVRVITDLVVDPCECWDIKPKTNKTCLKPVQKNIEFNMKKSPLVSTCRMWRSLSAGSLETPLNSPECDVQNEVFSPQTVTENTCSTSYKALPTIKITTSSKNNYYKMFQNREFGKKARETLSKLFHTKNTKRESLTCLKKRSKSCSTPETVNVPYNETGLGEKKKSYFTCSLKKEVMNSKTDDITLLNAIRYAEEIQRRSESLACILMNLK